MTATTGKIFMGFVAASAIAIMVATLSIRGGSKA
jgi:hypothetical protein